MKSSYRSEPHEYLIQGKQLNCTHCGNLTFESTEGWAHSRGPILFESSFEIDFFRCVRCGRIEIFRNTQITPIFKPTEVDPQLDRVHSQDGGTGIEVQCKSCGLAIDTSLTKPALYVVNTSARNPEEPDSLKDAA